jgi:hypothetical protein
MEIIVNQTNIDLIWFSYNNNTNRVGGITSNGTSVTYSTSSDYRLKENVNPINNPFEQLMKIKPVSFNWKSDSDKKIINGFIAHELQAIIPEAVTGTKDAVDEKGNMIPQGVDQSKLVPILVASLQQAIKKIEHLERRINVLEEMVSPNRIKIWCRVQDKN